MTKKDVIGHWYECKDKKCAKKIPMPDYIFITQDGEKIDEIEVFCPFCNIFQTFKFSEAKKPCSKKEALSYFTIPPPVNTKAILFVTKKKSFLANCVGILCSLE